jgi:hypothetical protein
MTNVRKYSKYIYINTFTGLTLDACPLFSRIEYYIVKKNLTFSASILFVNNIRNRVA